MSTQYARIADSGHTLTFSFCPSCGSTVHYTNDALPGFVGIPLGSLTDSVSWAPALSVYERSKRPWVELPAHMDRSQS